MSENNEIFEFTDELDENIDSKAKKIGTVFSKIGIVLSCVIISFVIAVFGFSAVACYGPSDNFKEKFVSKVSERSYTKFLADIYLSDAEINGIINR